MIDESQDPAIPGSGSGEDGTSISKFKSPEERDRAYLELEKLSYSQTQRMADLERKLEQMEQMQQPAAPADTRSFTDLYPAAQPQLDRRETELASRLLTKPSEVLKQHAEYVRQATLREVQQEMMAQRAIDRFQMENPDLVRHEDLVGVFVRKQPDNISPSERLKRAAPEVRKYLAEIAKGTNQGSPQLDPSTYVESPTSQPSGAPSAPAAAPSQEDELSEMIRERSAIQAKKRL